MMGYGLSTLVTTRNMQSLVTKLNREYLTSSMESVSGRVANLAEAMRGDVGKIHLIEKAIADNKSWTEAMELTRNDFAVAQNTLEVTRERASDMAADIEAAVGLENETSLDAIASSAAEDLQLLVDSLNSAFSGRQLFSGAKTDTPPISSADQIVTDVKAIVAGGADAAAIEAALDTYFNDPAGVFQTTIYQGSTADAPDRQVSANQRVGMEVKATDKAIRDTIRGLALMTVADDVISDDEMLKQVRLNAADSLNIGSYGIVELQSKMGAAESRLNALTATTEAKTFTLEETLTNLLGVDQYEAASRMTELETQLQTAYLATSKLSSLTLVNYLR